tara:strand:- start:1253 stop:3223 length:1971 start_codon:yes stop_codon:yes gene_type:complete
MAIDYSEFVTAPEYEKGMPAALEPEAPVEERLKAYIVANTTGPRPKKAGDFQDDWDAQAKEAAIEFHEKERVKTSGSFADAVGQGLYGFGDEAAGFLGATIGTFDPNMSDTTWGERYKGIRDVARDQAASYAQREPAMSLAGNIAGGLLTAPLGGPVSAARTLATSRAAPTIGQKLTPFAKQGAAHGAVFGAGAAEEMGDIPSSVLQHAVMGGVGGSVLPFAGQAVRQVAAGKFKPQVNITQQAGKTSPIADPIPMSKGKVGPPAPPVIAREMQHSQPAYAEAVERLQKKFANDPTFRLTSGQKTGSTAKATETSLAKSTSPPLRNQIDNNQLAVQRKMMDLAGFKKDHPHYRAGTISDDLIADTQDVFNARYGDFKTQKPINWNIEKVNNKLAEISKQNRSPLDASVDKQLNQTIQTFRKRLSDGWEDTGKWTLKDAQDFRSALRQEQSDLINTDPRTSRLYKNLKHLVDDQVAENSGMGPAKKALDLEYARFKNIRDTHDKITGVKGLQPANFNISSVLRESKKVGQDKELIELLSDAQMVLGDPLESSGTAERLNILMGGNLAKMGGGALAGSFLDPTGGSQGMLIGALIPEITKRAREQTLARGLTGAKGLLGIDRVGSAVPHLLGGLGLLGGEMNTPLPPQSIDYNDWQME